MTGASLSGRKPPFENRPHGFPRDHLWPDQGPRTLIADPSAGRPPLPRARVSRPDVPALPRTRLDWVLDRLWDQRAVLVVAPAGSGKTTLLAQLAASAGVPLAWFRAEAGDGTPTTLLRGLAGALSPITGAFDRDPRCLEDLVGALDAWQGDRALLLVDDLHVLLGTPAERLVERLFDYLPPAMRLLLASRCAPGFNLSRLRVSGRLCELSADELRFRSWEVEQLFREFYKEPLPPEDLAELARRTEGWAAGLQLFHLATRGKPTSERRRMVAELGSRSRMVREYLARNVLDQLPHDLRSFLLETCMLGRLTGPLCDELLDRTDSRAVLEDLERQQIFTVPIGDGAYRYHEVLRSHLELVLVEQVGDAEVKARHRRAGRLLQNAGAFTDALRAFSRADDWDAVAALLGREGEQLAAGQGSWLDALPPGLYQHDPWLLLAKGRRETARGHLRSALSTYDSAAAAFGPTSAADVCRRERQAVHVWLESAPAARGDWVGLLRAATQREPLVVADEAGVLGGAIGQFTEGLARLLAGQMREAHRLLVDSSDLPDTPPVLGVIARLFAALAARAAGKDPAERLPGLIDEAEALDIPWVMRVARSLAVVIATKGEPDVTPLQASNRHDGDPWAAALVSLVEGLVGLWHGHAPVSILEEAALGFRRLGAGVGETWARSGAALAIARAGHPEARDVALAAIRCARSTGVPGAEALALLALARGDQSRHDDVVLQASQLAEQCGLRLPFGDGGYCGSSSHPPSRAVQSEPWLRSPVDSGPRQQPSDVSLRCFGGFQLGLGDRTLDGRGLKPRPRAALQLLALHAGRPVHRESLLEALWPEVDMRVGTRNLHVAISTVRRFLEPHGSRGAASLVVREGDAYRLALPEGSTVDTWELEAGLAAGRTARSAGDWEAAIDAFERALAAYAGELLPEAGPAEWVVVPRERYRVLASEAALMLTELHLERGDPTTAVKVGEQGLRIDRYRDSQWRVLVTACERAGDRAAAVRIRRSYSEVLAELGLDPASVGGVAAPV